MIQVQGPYEGFTEYGEYDGFRKETFDFQGKKATVIFPETPVAGNKWLLKTEYLGSFPAFEEQMLKKGYAVAHVDNETRWCLPTDTQRQSDFCDYLTKQYGFSRQCVVVGMSCGGMQGILLAAAHPEKVAVLYLDAPVVNLLSCPCYVSTGEANPMYEEMKQATGWDVKFLMQYRNHPLDKLGDLIKNRIPCVLVTGDADRTVFWDENAQLVQRTYEASDVPFMMFVKNGGDHHPHGLADNTPIISFVEEQLK